MEYKKLFIKKIRTRKISLVNLRLSIFTPSFCRILFLKSDFFNKLSFAYQIVKFKVFDIQLHMKKDKWTYLLQSLKMQSNNQFLCHFTILQRVCIWRSYFKTFMVYFTWMLFTGCVFGWMNVSWMRHFSLNILCSDILTNLDYLSSQLDFIRNHPMKLLFNKFCYVYVINFMHVPKNLCHATPPFL